MPTSATSALVLTSCSARHLYFARIIAESFQKTVTISQPKRNYYIKQSRDSDKVVDHFEKLYLEEKKWFPQDKLLPKHELKIVNDINSQELVKWAKNLDFDVVCLFGTEILNAGWLAAYPNKIINLHLGLSPFYRGSATLFWPFFFKELQYLGTTIHLASSKVDGGDMLKRIGADISPSEDYYSITSRLIRQSIELFPSIITGYLNGSILPIKQNNEAFRIFKKSDFDEKSLKQALEYIGEGLLEEEIEKIRRMQKCLFL